MIRWILLLTLIVCGIARGDSLGAEEPAPLIPLRATVLGTKYPVRDQFNEVILKTIRELRRQIRDHKAKGQFVGYISVPLSARGGGWYATNAGVSAQIKDRLETELGKDDFWLLPPGQVEAELPLIGGERASGGEYLYMWTEVLAGEDGLGRDFDFVYFAGPSDFSRFFGGAGPLAARIRAYIAELQKTDPAFAKEVTANSDRIRDYLKYYATRASVSFSAGCHDEWNIFVRINRKRDLGDQIGASFDGRPLTPVDLESMIRLGYESP